jgi:galactarate dehydratase (D-threo-forming)
MRICAVELIPVHTPRETGAISQHVVVRLRTDEGPEGLGEVSDITDLRVTPDLEDLQRTVASLLVGADTRRIGTLAERLGRRYSGHIRCAFEVALFDLLGKELGVPVSTLLGGAVRDRFKVCYPIFPQRGPADVEPNIARVGRVLAQGFDLIRVYCGVDLAADELFLRTLRETHGDRVRIKSLDFSRRLHWKQAIPAIRRFEQYEPMLVESPCADVEGKAEVRRQVGVPISEHVSSAETALRFAQAGAVDIFNIATCSGGLNHARKLFALAEALQVQTLIGTTQELSIGTAAQAHLGATMPNLDWPCDPTGPQLYQEDVVRQRIRYEEGYLIVPDGPGLGVVIDEERLQALRRPLTQLPQA